MTETRFTPGPWAKTEVVFSKKDWAELNDGKEPITVVRANWDGWTGDVVAAVWGDTEEEEAACAHLIAAAPRMYHAGYALAMLALQSDRYRDDPEYREATDNMLEVLTQARGESVKGE